ncbi:peptidase [Streptomyces griseoluteus]|uniref:Peptidase n=1 Tax=Streptomyces griseoluteus TaxID=29306 RepID=A0A4Z1DL77_STRGP|nr:Clp protease N-terminal domain-containing protein [Streptomyces griseoluteus]TGN84970.1 peptidase [Streptomyces griseoluteus]GHF02870.1 peptidase [Streptomyces griseoluteus]
MEPRTAGRTVPDEGGAGAPDDTGLDATLAAVVAGARRRAVRDGDRQIDTAHLLHSLLDADPEARAAMGPHLVRLLGYLVQRSIGYGLGWQRVAEGGGTPGAVPRPVRDDGTFEGPERWSPLAAEAMRDARRRADRRGELHAAGLDLLAALVADPRSRAVEVLEHAGIPAGALAARKAPRATGG